MLGLSENHINIQVYRLRKSIAKLLPENVMIPQLIDRRSGEIRFGSGRVEITGGNLLGINLGRALSARG